MKSLKLKIDVNNQIQKNDIKSSRRKINKVINIYKNENITLKDFGLIFSKKLISAPKSRVSTQGGWSHDKVDITAPNEPIKEEVDKPFCCKFCGRENVIKYGKKSGKQFYKCKDCNRGFVDNLYFEGLKGNPNVICVTLDLYFKGVSVRQIADHLKQFYDLKVHFTTIFKWIKKYIQIMDKYVSQFQPKLGIVWHADEMMIAINGEWHYLWNIMDEFTRFHLASVISKERKIMDARKAFQKAKKTSHDDRPQSIITDGLGSYHKAINKEFHTTKKETIHLGSTGINGKFYKNVKYDNNLIERLHGTIRNRNKTQRGLKSEETILMKGHQLYYNYIKPHESLNGYTPAHFANIYLDLGDKKWENLLLQAIKSQNMEKI